MSFRFRAVLAGAASAAVLVATAGVAFAASPPYEPDTSGNQIGGLLFYNASGTQIFGGSTTDAPFAAFVEATTPGRGGDTKAFVFFATPKVGQASGAWANTSPSGTSVFPNSGAPGALATAALPVYAASSGDTTVAQAVQEFPNSDTTSDGFAGLYQVRLKTSGPGQPAGANYDSADILVTGTTWTEVYSADPAPTATSTTLGVTPTSPQTVGSFGGTKSVSLTATVSPAGAVGSVQFLDGTTALGSPVAIASGSASATATLGVGTHPLTAKFIPENPGTTNPVTDPTPDFATSTSTVSSYQVNNPAATATSTLLAVNTGSTTAFAPVTFTATVSPAAAPGSVSFVDGSTTLGTTGPTAAGSGTFTFQTSALAAGSHSVTATFNPTNPAQFAASSSSPPNSFTLGAQLYAPAVGNITASIPAGTLVISTPYTAQQPLALGPLALNPSATEYTGTAAFGSAGGDGLTVTDTRAGALPWTASALASPLAGSPGGSINGENVGLTGVTPDFITGNSLQAGSVVVTNNPAANGVSPADLGTLGLGNTTHSVASAADGDGSVGFYGTLTIVAPTSTPAGAYAGTITFTIG